MKPEFLSKYLLEINKKSKVDSLLGKRGGYIVFNNTSNKFFTLGLDSIISALVDISNNLDEFQTILKYDEGKWRDLAGVHFTDSAANAMSTVQSMGMYNALSKLIFAANNIDFNIFKDGHILFEKELIEKTIIELDNLALKYEPKDSAKKNDIILEKQNLKWIVFNSFKYLISKYNAEILLKDYKEKVSTINNTDYRGISLPNYFNSDNLIGIFREEQSKEELKSSNTERYFEEKISVLDNEFSYFTTQWGDVKGNGLTLDNFNLYLGQISDNTLEIIREGKLYSLISKNKFVSKLKKLEQKIYYGAPGTGKSYKVDIEIKNLSPTFYERITFHPEFDHSSFVGGYRPISEKDEEGKDLIKYKFVPQAFTNIYNRAWNDENNQYYLVIEEINRGNCAEIFGDIFQLLDRNSNYTVSPSTELKEHLEKVLTNKDGINNGLKLPSNLSIYATMNTSDQSLFPMDSAFKRRWDWEYIPICYDNVPENESFNYIVNIDESTSFKWIDFIKNANAIIKANPNLGMDKCIGNYFIKSESNKIPLNEFVNKAIFYLWNDVFKDEDSSDSIFEKGTSYEDFFPINSNGKDLINKIIEKLKIEISPKDN